MTKSKEYRLLMRKNVKLETIKGECLSNKWGLKETCKTDANLKKTKSCDGILSKNKHFDHQSLHLYSNMFWF